MKYSSSLETYTMIWKVILFVLSFSVVINSQNSTCGRQAVPPHAPWSVHGRIVGGKEAIPHSWPWMVLLRWRDYPISCGGVLVRGQNGDIVVLTAGHCIDFHSYNLADWKIDLGQHSRSALEPAQQEYGVSELLVHPSFSYLTLGADIGIIKPDRKIVENDFIRPACFPTQTSNNIAGQRCVVTGWGSNVEGGPPLDRLHEVYKPILSDAVCASNLGPDFVGSDMICGGNLAEGGTDFCTYDSGVPLACNNTSGSWEVVGLGSWGQGCARPGLPGVYTEVFTYMGWVMNNTQTSTGSGTVG